jgi:hypothetical protein
MVSSLLLRGMLAGLVAGLLAFGFAKAFGEPQIDRAIGVEEQLAHAHGEAPEPELVSRETQSTVGLLTGILVYAVSVGGLFALVFAFLYGRVGDLSPRTLSLILAAVALIVLMVVPALKYPPNPPSVGQPDTIAFRTQMYFAMIGLSLASAGFATWLCRRLVPRYGRWNGGVAAILCFIGLVVAGQFLLPGINEVPASFPAVTLWEFRVASLGIHLILWSIIGLLFGALSQDRLTRT